MILFIYMPYMGRHLIIKTEQKNLLSVFLSYRTKALDSHANRFMAFEKPHVLLAKSRLLPKRIMALHVGLHSFLATWPHYHRDQVPYQATRKPHT